MNPFRIESPHLVLEPFRPIYNKDAIVDFANDIFDILHDNKVVVESPDKKIVEFSQAIAWVENAIIGYQLKQSHTYYIKVKSLDKVVGFINVLLFNSFPSGKQRFYETQWPQFVGCCEIEYYLNSEFWGQKIMSNSIKSVTDSILLQNIPGVSASVLSTNKKSIQVLKNAGFTQLGLLPQPNGQTYSHQMKAKARS